MSYDYKIVIFILLRWNVEFCCSRGWLLLFFTWSLSVPRGLLHQRAPSELSWEGHNILTTPIWHPERRHSPMLPAFGNSSGKYFHLPSTSEFSSFYLIYRFLAKFLPVVHSEPETHPLFKVGTEWAVSFLCPFFVGIFFFPLRATSLKKHNI